MRTASFKRIAGATLLVALGCSDGAGPDGASVRIQAGANITDTVTTRLSQALVAEVRGSDGRAETGVQVRFESLHPQRVAVGEVTGTRYGTVAGGTTDSRGRAAVLVAMGTEAGLAQIAVSVPLYNVADTAEYTVLPGAAVRVALSPDDTTLVLGSNFQYIGSTVDRFGNARPDPGTYDIVAGGAAIVEGGRVSALHVGESLVRVRAQFGGRVVEDTGRVAVVPPGLLALRRVDQLALGDLTGRVERTLVHGAAYAPDWSPEGDRVVFNREGGLFLVDLNGAITPLQTPSVTNATWPDFGPDGWIYFQANPGPGNRMFRIRSDGSGMERLTDLLPGEMPTPSPDGGSVAYISGEGLYVMDLATRQFRRIARDATSPRWSPDGQWIAYLTDPFGALMLVRPDGTGAFRIGDHGLYPGIAWSPDSKYIVGNARHLTLVDIARRTMLDLGFYAIQPAWKP